MRVSDIGAGKRIRNLATCRNRLSPLAVSSLPLVKAKAGTLLFPKSGAAVTTNSRAILAVDAYIVSHLMAVSPHKTVLSDWLYWWMCQIDMMDYSDNAAYPSLKQSVVEKIGLPLPPLAEQKRIVGILNEKMGAIDKARAAAKAQLEAANALQVVYLREIFPQQGQELPLGWRWTRLCEICQGKGQYGLSIKASLTPPGTAVLGMNNIKEGRIRWDNVKFIRLPAELINQYKLMKGDILFNRTNSAELVGKSAVFNDDKDAVFASYLIRIRTKPDIVLPEFLCLYINSGGKAFIEKSMTRAIGQVNISASTLNHMPVPIPRLAEQSRLLIELDDRFAKIDYIKAGLEKQLSEINALPQALLRQAFHGEL